MTTCDVLIVGGGPCGSTLAAFLAQSGVSVRIVEREFFPRYHIGESLLPQVLDVLEESGALSAVEAHGFLRKEGGIFRWGKLDSPWFFYFDETRQRYRYTYAYQVLRSEFDELLLKHARSCGTTAEEGVSARELVVDEFSPTKYGVVVTVRSQSGGERKYRCRIVADCSGHAGWLASNHRWRKFDPVLRNVAIFKYFRGAKRMSGRNTNGIFCEATPDGWFWNIPLHDGSNSVGLVTKATRNADFKTPAELFEKAIERSRYLKEQLVTAESVAPLRVIRDYSYRSQTLFAPGLILAGDAGNFVDPVWSTGVFLATTGAKLASGAIFQWLRTGELSGFAQYAQEVHRLVDFYREFIHFFYGANEEPEGIFWKAYSMVQGSVDPKDAFIKLVSGRLFTEPSPV